MLYIVTDNFLQFGYCLGAGSLMLAILVYLFLSKTEPELRFSYSVV